MNCMFIPCRMLVAIICRITKSPIIPEIIAPKNPAKIATIIHITRNGETTPPLVIMVVAATVTINKYTKIPISVSCFLGSQKHKISTIKLPTPATPAAKSETDNPIGN